MNFIWHVPSFIDTDMPPVKAEGTIEEILQHPWIDGWRTRYPERQFEGFFYSAEPYDRGSALMAVYDDNNHFWVVGFLDNIPNLPRWTSSGMKGIGRMPTNAKKVFRQGASDTREGVLP